MVLKGDFEEKKSPFIIGWFFYPIDEADDLL